MIRFIFLALFLTCVVCDSVAQEVSFKTFSGAKQVVVGSTFEVTFSIENADEKNFKPPDFGPFKRVSGPAQSYQSSFVNGRSTKSISYTYTLQATKVGKFKISGASATINGKILQSNPVQIEVVKQGANLASTPSADKIFIRAELDTTHLFVGQQAVLRYKIYTQVNIENYNILAESSYDGCYTQILDAYKDRAIKEVIDGEEYTTKVLRKVAIFPQQNGKITIDPLAVRVGIPDRTQRRRSFFSSFNLKTKNLSSNAVDLFVRSPHTSAPPGFSGAVGYFTGRFVLHPNQITTDDVITLRLKIAGNGDVKMIRPPKLDLPPSFETYDPKILDEKMITTRDSIRGEKLIEYLILANEPGNYQIKPEFTFLDVEQGKFITLQDSFTITIKQGQNMAQSDNRLDPAREKHLADAMMSTALSRDHPPIISSPWYWTAMGVPLLGFLLLGWRSHQKRLSDEDRAIDHTAIADDRLRLAQQHLDRGDAQAFYEALAICIKNYLASKIDLPAAEQSKESIRMTLEKIGLEKEVIDRLIVMLDQCDYALYAGMHDPKQMSSAYRDAIEIVKVLEHKLP